MNVPGADWPHNDRSSIVSAGGIRFHVQRMGSGPELLLLHGTGASSHSFRALMPLLAERFSVIAPDLPGHAYSEAPPWFEPSVGSMSSAVSELLRAMGARPSVVVGHSAGAALLAKMSLDREIAPRLFVGLAAALFPLRGVARAVLPRAARLFSAASSWLPMSAPDARTVDLLLRSTGSPLDGPGVELYRRLSERPSHVSAVLAMMSRWDVAPVYRALHRFEPRVLLLAGARDRAVPVSQQRAIAARFPRAALTVLAGTGHLLHEEQPGETARHIVVAWEALDHDGGRARVN